MRKLASFLNAIELKRCLVLSTSWKASICRELRILVESVSSDLLQLYPRPHDQIAIIFRLRSLETQPSLSLPTLLHAAHEGSAGLVRHILRSKCLLLPEGIDATGTGRWFGRSALDVAAAAGHAHVLATLLDEGASLQQQHHQSLASCTPLVLACRGGHLDVVKVIVARIQSPAATEKGSKQGRQSAPRAVETRGGLADSSPLVSACEGGHWEVVRFLLRSLPTRAAHPPSCAAGGSPTRAPAEQQLAVERRRSASPLPCCLRLDEVTARGTALLAACSRGGAVDVVITLLRLGCAVNGRHPSPTLASGVGSRDSSNSSSKSGTGGGSSSGKKVGVSSGDSNKDAPRSVVVAVRRTPLVAAVCSGDDATVRALLATRSPAALAHAVSSGQLTAARTTAGGEGSAGEVPSSSWCVNVNAVGAPGGKTALMVAASAAPSAAASGSGGGSGCAMVDALLAAGADATVRCSRGRTALWYAVEAGRVAVVARLLGSGQISRGEAMRVSGYGCTPSFLARHAGGSSSSGARPALAAAQRAAVEVIDDFCLLQKREQQRAARLARRRSSEEPPPPSAVPQQQPRQQQRGEGKQGYDGSGGPPMGESNSDGAERLSPASLQRAAEEAEWAAREAAMTREAATRVVGHLHSVHRRRPRQRQSPPQQQQQHKTLLKRQQRPAQRQQRRQRRRGGLGSVLPPPRAAPSVLQAGWGRAPFPTPSPLPSIRRGGMVAGAARRSPFSMFAPATHGPEWRRQAEHDTRCQPKAGKARRRGAQGVSVTRPSQRSGAQQLTPLVQLPNNQIRSATSNRGAASLPNNPATPQASLAPTTTARVEAAAAAAKALLAAGRNSDNEDGDTRRQHGIKHSATGINHCRGRMSAPTSPSSSRRAPHSNRSSRRPSAQPVGRGGSGSLHRPQTANAATSMAHALPCERNKQQRWQWPQRQRRQQHQPQVGKALAVVGPHSRRPQQSQPQSFPKARSRSSVSAFLSAFNARPVVPSSGSGGGSASIAGATAAAAVTADRRLQQQRWRMQQQQQQQQRSTQLRLAAQQLQQEQTQAGACAAAAAAAAAPAAIPVTAVMRPDRLSNHRRHGAGGRVAVGGEHKSPCGSTRRPASAAARSSTATTVAMTAATVVATATNVSSSSGSTTTSMATVTGDDDALALYCHDEDEPMFGRGDDEAASLCQQAGLLTKLAAHHHVLSKKPMDAQ